MGEVLGSPCLELCATGGAHLVRLTIDQLTLPGDGAVVCPCGLCPALGESARSLAHRAKPEDHHFGTVILPGAHVAGERRNPTEALGDCLSYLAEACGVLGDVEAVDGREAEASNGLLGEDAADKPCLWDTYSRGLRGVVVVLVRQGLFDEEEAQLGGERPIVRSEGQHVGIAAGV